MKLYVNAGFGDLLGAQNLGWIRGHGFSGIRQEVKHGDMARDILKEIDEAQLDALILVGGGFMDWISYDHIVELAAHVATAANEVGLVESGRFAIEIGNEPDNSHANYKSDAALFARLVRESAAAIWQRVPNATVISGGVMNTHASALNYLGDASRAGFPDGCHIGYHSYHTTSAPEVPHDRFRSRQEEFDRLKKIVGNRPMWCTEVGWHTYPSKITARLWPPRAPRTVQFNDAQVADFTARELLLHKNAGAVCAAVFQLNDADVNPPTSYEHRHGIRFVNGDAKPVALKIREIAPTLA